MICPLEMILLCGLALHRAKCSFPVRQQMMWDQLEMPREKSGRLHFMNTHHLFGYHGYCRAIAVEDCSVSVVDAIECPCWVLLGTVVYLRW